MPKGEKVLVEPLDKKSREELESMLGHRFDEPALLVRALIHRSYRNEVDGVEEDNERLEFLGDAVLDLVVAQVLWQREPSEDEGSLTRARSAVVSERGLAICARKLNLGGYLYLGRGEESTGGRERDSILADFVEALLGAVFADGGFEAACSAAENMLEPVLEKDFLYLAIRDPRSRLQEIVQGDGFGTPAYKVVSSVGPTHDPHFVVQVNIGDDRVFQGEGRTKKGASRRAAKAALAVLVPAESGDQQP